MSALWEATEYWPVRVALAGGLILLVGRLLLVLTRQPARRSLIGTATVAAALLVVPLSMLPGWLPVRVGLATLKADALVETPNPEPSTADAYAVLDIPPALAAPAAGAVELAPPVAAIKPPPAEPMAATTAVSSSVNWWLIAMGAYGALVGLLVVRLAMGQVALSRLWRAARPVPDWAERVFRELAASVCPRAQLRASSRSAGPVCFGVWRPRILLPAKLLLAGDGPELRAVLAHELGHLRRRDPLTGWFLGLARAVYFVWPWLAGLRREVRLAQEYLADADAARTTGPADYAEMLIRMTRARPAPLGAAAVRGPSSELYRRVTMVLRTSGRVEGRCPRRWALAVGGGLTALAIAAAGLYVQPRSAVAAEPEKKEAEKPAAKPEAKPDLFKEAIDRLRKDLGDNPEAVKQLDELIKMLKEGKLGGPVALPVPGVAHEAPPLPMPPPLPPPPRRGRIDRPDLDKEFDQAQEMIRQYLEQMAAQLRAGGIQGNGVIVGPAGALRPFVAGGGRLGIRVEKPSDVLAAQLELPLGKGLVCVDVPADSPAGKAGIKPNDILLEVAGKSVPSNRDEFVKSLKDVKPDTPVDVVVLRKGKKETLKGVKLPEAKEVPDFPVLPRLDFGDFQGPGIIVAPPIPVPPAGDFPALPRAGRNTGVVVGPGETARVEQVNDAFTVFYTKDGVKVTISGSKDADGVAKAESIEVEAGGKTTKAESIEKLPKEYQDLAKKAMKSIK